MKLMPKFQQEMIKTIGKPLEASQIKVVYTTKITMIHKTPV